MTTQKLAVAKAEHTSWRAMLDALKAAGYITEDDMRARTSDRSTPQREWISDSLAWLNGKTPPRGINSLRLHDTIDEISLEHRFKALFPGEELHERLSQWIDDAWALQELREAQAV